MLVDLPTGFFADLLELALMTTRCVESARASAWSWFNIDDSEVQPCASVQFNAHLLAQLDIKIDSGSSSSNSAGV